MEGNALKYLIAISQFPKFGPVRLKKLLDHFGDPERIFRAGAGELAGAGLAENLASEFAAFRQAVDPEDLLSALEREGIKILIKGEGGYPRLLAEIYDPPLALYCRGELPPESEYCIAIVGTRKHTGYGQQAAETIARDLARAGLAIASGLALGIDTIAHEAALAVRGRTIAVLGSGLDRQSLYPAANRYLADKIAASGGALLSEFPLGTPPLRHHFPQRNRLIAGLSLGTVVIEAGEKSGSLITARHALEQNREVFALPGPVFSPASYGPNLLIKQGAAAVTEAADIISALDLKQITAYIDNKKILPETAEEKSICAQLGFEPRHIDEIARLTGLTAAAVSGALVMMEMKGLVKNLGGAQYVLAR